MLLLPGFNLTNKFVQALRDPLLAPVVVVPYLTRGNTLASDQRLLDEFGGGAIHFCGRGSHYIAHMARLHGLHAIAMSQPEYNDMEAIYQHTVDRGIKLLGLKREAAEQALARGRDLYGQVHCW